MRRADKVLIADFSVSGGGTDSTLGRVVSDAVGSGLAQARTFTLVTPGELAAALRRMQLPPASRVTMVLARQIAEREGFKAILDGSVTAVGGAYIVAVRLVRADSGRELTSHRATATGPDKLIEASDDVARKLLSKTGESLRRVQGAPPLEQVTTSSIEALRKYGDAVRANDMEADPLKAVPLLREAVAIDSGFAEAWRKLGVAIRNAGLPRSGSDSAVAKAFALRHRLTDGERRRMEADYYLSGPNRDRGRGIAAYEAMLENGDSLGVLNNLANEYRNRREFARAESLYRVALARTPRSRLIIGNLLFVLGRQGKFAEHDSLARASLKVFPDDSDYQWSLMSTRWLRGEVDEAVRWVDSARRARPDPRDPAQAVREAARLAVFRGQARQAVAYQREVSRIDSTIGRRQSPVLAAVSEVGARVDLGLPVEAEVRVLDAALQRSPLDAMPQRERPYFPIVRAYARANRTDDAKAVLESYRSFADSAWRRVWMNAEREVESDIAIAERRFSDAARLLRLSDSLPDGPAHLCGECLPRALMRVFSEAGMADSAVAAYEEYRKTPVGARKWSGQDVEMAAPLLERMARMFLAKGDTTRAAEFLGMFVDRWKNADPELQPRVAAAREQLRRLQLDAPKR